MGSAAVVPFVDPGDGMGGMVQGDAAQSGLPAAPPPPAPGTLVQPQPAPQPAQQPMPGKRGSGALDGILKALGGSVDTQYSVDPSNGQLAQAQVPQGPGAYARNIIAGAVQGLAAGASAGPGPGHNQRGLAAGVQAGMGMAQGQDQAKQQAALGNYDRDQQSRVRSAQMALLNQQITRGSFDLSRAKVAAGEHDSAAENEMGERINEDPNAVDLGVVTAGNGKDHTHALSDAMAAHTDALRAHANGHLVSLPHVGSDGNIDGVHYWQVSPDFKNVKTSEPTPIRRLVPGKADGDPGRYDVQNLPAGMSQGDVLAMQQAVANGNLQTRAEENTQKQENLRAAGNNATSRANAQTEAASRERVEQMGINSASGGTGGSPGGAGGGAAAPDFHALSPAMQDTISRMAHYNVDPATFPASVRKGTGQMSRATATALAAQINPDYDDKQYKSRSSYLKDLTGNGKGAATVRSLNTAIGHLGTLNDDFDALGNSGVPAANGVANAFESKILGDARQGRVGQAVNAVSDELTTAFRNTGGSESDVKGWKESFAPNGSRSQQRGSVGQAAELLGSRISAFDQQYAETMGGGRPFRLLNDNSRKVLHTLGQDKIIAMDDAGYAGHPGEIAPPNGRGATQQQAQGGAGPANNAPPPSPQTHVFNATAYAKANPGVNIQQAIAQAKSSGYQVVQ